MGQPSYLDDIEKYAGLKDDLRNLVERLKELDLLLPDMTETARADGYRFSYTEIEKLIGDRND